MTKQNSIIALFIICVVLGVFFFTKKTEAPTTVDSSIVSSSTVETNGTTPTQGTSTSPKTTSSGKTEQPKTTLKPTVSTMVYSNMAYGFSVRYPKGTSVESTFSGFYTLGKDWRVGATGMLRGTPVVSFIVKRMDNQYTLPKTYPTYFTAETRIGVTPDTTNCYAKDEGYQNQTITNVTLNGVAFKKFSFGDAAMMKYMQGESYRTIHNKQCYVIEQVKVGSSYKDENMKNVISDSLLTNYYMSAGDIARSFVFTK